MLLHQEISDKIINAFYTVYNTLGYGFLEKVYEKAMMVELLEMGLQVQRQVPIRVFYKGQSVGEYFAYLLVEELIIIELKTAENLCEAHECQLIKKLDCY